MIPFLMDCIMQGAVSTEEPANEVPQVLAVLDNITDATGLGGTHARK